MIARRPGPTDCPRSLVIMLGGYGEEVREAKDIQPALRRARESGKCALINVRVDPEVFSPGTMHQTMYK
jgi:acetolactate synthase I/II/III large subunit